MAQPTQPSPSTGPSSRGTPALIGIDWGTTSFRASALGRDGALGHVRSSASGITRVAGGNFEQVLSREIGDWLERYPHTPVIASGMIGARQGWVEAPYVACPAGAPEIAARLARTETADGRTIHFVPGLELRSGAGGVPDVIRGEETQLVGALAGLDGTALCVLPGTHCKWALVERGRVVWFATFMTGELFDVLRAHSILGRQMRAPDGPGEAQSKAFERGVRFGMAESAADGGLLRRLFSTRTLGLFGQLDEPGAHEYLSGLLIGAEVREALASLRATWPAAGAGRVTILGGEALTSRYAGALDLAGVAAQPGPSDAASRGHLAIARAAGLLPA